MITLSLCHQSCLVMDPSLRLSCEELLELSYFQEEAGLNWGREGERPGRRHDRGSRRRQAGVNLKHCGKNSLTHLKNKPLTLQHLSSALLSVFRLSTCLSYRTATSHLHQTSRNTWSINITCPTFNNKFTENCGWGQKDGPVLCFIQSNMKTVSLPQRFALSIL